MDQNSIREIINLLYDMKGGDTLEGLWKVLSKCIGLIGGIVILIIVLCWILLMVLLI